MQFYSLPELSQLFSSLKQQLSVINAKSTHSILPSQTGNAGKALITNGTTVSWATPTSSGGVRDAIPTNGSTNSVESNGVFDALALKANTASLSLVGTSGQYADLLSKPTIRIVETYLTYVEAIAAATGTAYKEISVTNNTGDVTKNGKYWYEGNAGVLVNSNSTGSVLSLSLVGTAGAGFIEIPTQSSNPSTPTSGIRIFSNSTGKFAWKGSNGFVRSFDNTAITADRSYTLPNVDGTVILDSATQTLTNKTITSPAFNGSGTFTTANAGLYTPLTFSNSATSGSTVTGVALGFLAWDGSALTQMGTVIISSSSWSFGSTFVTNQFMFNSAGSGGVGFRNVSGGWRWYSGNASTFSAPEVFRMTGTGTLSNTGADAVASSVLDLASTTKGVLLPRMTNTQKTAISSPATGLTLYCTDCTATDASTGVMQTWNGSAWKNNW